MKKLYGISSLAVGLLIASAAQAGERFDTLQGVPATALSAEEMASIEAKNHVLRLVQQQSGRALPNDASVDATTNAGSIDGVGQDRPHILSLLD